MVDLLSASKVVTRKRKKIRSLCLRLCKKSETVFAWRRFIFLLSILTANIIKKEDVFMNTLVIVLIAVVVLGLGYVLVRQTVLLKNGY